MPPVKGIYTELLSKMFEFLKKPVEVNRHSSPHYPHHRPFLSRVHQYPGQTHHHRTSFVFHPLPPLDQDNLSGLFSYRFANELLKDKDILANVFVIILFFSSGLFWLASGGCYRLCKKPNKT